MNKGSDQVDLKTMDFTNHIGVFAIFLFFLVHVPLAYFAKTGGKNLLLAYSSVAIYGLWYPPGVLLVLFMAGIGFAFTRVRFSPKWQKTILTLCISLCLATLFVFKYFDFFTNLIGLEHHLDFVLPVGLSFYTFTVIGYLVDHHRREGPSLKTFSDNLLLVVFWPHLAAGPILRSPSFATQIITRIRFSWRDYYFATILVVNGAIKKVLIADNLGAYVNQNLSEGISKMHTLDALVTILGFGGQIYADFSGYTDMAIGLALFVGFKLPANFNYPYLSTTLTEFWRRWHISLSTWFRDYVFIPLGGSRGSALRTFRNLMIVFLLSGFWHGAGYNFVMWGAIHGLFVALEKIGYKHYIVVSSSIRWLVTMAIVTVAWTFFRLDIVDASELLRIIFQLRWNASASSPYALLPIVFFLILIALDHIVRVVEVDRDNMLMLRSSRWKTFYLLGMFGVTLLFSGKPLPYIYFNF
ncbi:MAG: MBOAT family protein [Oligoflexales bacterium]